MMRKNTQSYYDAFMYAALKNNHILVYSRPYPDFRNVSDEEFDMWCNDDVFKYVYWLNEDFGVKVSKGNLSSGALWNAFDSLYLLSMYHVLAHIGKGTRQISTPKIMFSTNYNLTPFGHEHCVNLFYRNDGGLLTKINARKGMGENYGIGVKLMNIPLTKVLDSVDVGIDLWSQRFPEKTRRYNGFGAGFSVEGKKYIGEKSFVNIGIRAKTRGYNLGDSLKGNFKLYFGIGCDF